MNLLGVLTRIGGITLFGRIVSLIRDTLMASVFGAGIASDAFLVAFRVPNFLRRVFVEGAFNHAFVPVLTEYSHLRDLNATRQLLSRVSTGLGMILVVITALGILATPWILNVLAPGFDGEKAQLTETLLRIVLPYIVFISLVSLAGSVLNVFNRYYVPAFTPVWLNVSLIIAMLWFTDYFALPISALAWAVCLGGALQLAFQLPFLYKIGMLPRWDWNWRDSDVRRILGLMLPSMLGVSAAQVSLLLNALFASFMVSGSVTWLYYADRMMELPSCVLGAALGTVLLPNLSKTYVLGDQVAYCELLDWGLRLSILLAMPAVVGFFVLAVPLVVTLFGYGRFDGHDLAMTEAALIAYSMGLLGFITIKILVSAFYSRQNIKTPVRIACFVLCFSQVLNLILVLGLDMHHVGLALSISLGALLNAALLLLALYRSGTYQPQPGWWKFLLKVALALVLMGVALLLSRGNETSWLYYGLWQRLLHLSVLFGLGAGVYFTTLFVMGIRLSDYMKKVGH